MTLEDYFKGVQTKLRGELDTFLNVQIGAGALAMIDRRVRQKGEKSEGGQFKPYSSKPTLIGASSFTSKTHSDKVFGKEKNKALDWVTYRGHKLAVMPGGYKQIREVEGRQTDHKDFERTSALWQSIHVIGTKETAPGRYQTSVGTENPASINKMQGIIDREASELLSLSDSEAQNLSNVLAEKLKTIFE